MRWNFADSTLRWEESRKTRFIELMDLFWVEFGKVSERIYRDFNAQDYSFLVTWFNRRMSRFNVELFWTISRCDDKKLFLIITASGVGENRPIVETFVSRAPDFPDWIVQSYKPPLVRECSKIEDNRISGDWSDLKFSLQKCDDNVIEVSLYSNNFHGINLDEDVDNAIVLGEILLGEENLDKWIGAFGAISLTQQSGASGEELSKAEFADKLHAEFESLKDSIRNTLPRVPYHELEFEQSLSTLSLEHVNDASRTSCESCLPHIIESVMQRFIFHSCRFSNFDELFCYLKFQCEVTESSETFLPSIRKELDARLVDAKAGRCFGYGAGREYFFLDLVLSDIERAREVISSLAEEYNFSRSSWIKFFDRYYMCEWVGVYHDTPKPSPDEAW